jgi:hypothetical protein
MVFLQKLKYFYGYLFFFRSLLFIFIEYYLELVKESLEVFSVVTKTDDYIDFDRIFIYFEKFKYLKYLDIFTNILFGIDYNLLMVVRISF